MYSRSSLFYGHIYIMIDKTEHLYLYSKEKLKASDERAYNIFQGAWASSIWTDVIKTAEVNSFFF